MPAIAKTSDLDIIDSAREIIARSGVDGLSMQAIAKSVGIKAPSLYKRFSGREEIIRCVQVAEFESIEKRIIDATRSLDTQSAVRGIASVLWQIARDSPSVYAILYAPGSITEKADVEIRTRALSPMFAVCRTLFGAGIALAAARTLMSYIHGFIALQQSGAFDGTAGIEGSFYFGLNSIIKGMGADTRKDRAQ